jgi:F0F1-type ATP synthase epsilon subunit
MTLLGEGIVKVTKSGATPIRLKVAGGFLQVAANVVRIVAGSASPAID